MQYSLDHGHCSLFIIDLDSKGKIASNTAAISHSLIDILQFCDKRVAESCGNKDGVYAAEDILTGLIFGGT